ncbi:MAG TPA: peptidylprolyl isomerase [Longimicrobiales bacterium]|nr:peptidylprolyl isomerase [Longimicrobiales bacterium]
MTRTLFLAGALLCAAVPLAAQEPEQRIDRVGHIVAMVGDSAILNFDIQEAILARAAQVRQQPPDPGTPEYAQLEKIVLDDLIAELLVLQDALRDTTIVVPEDQIARAVQRQIDQDQQQLGGAVQLESELRTSGRTLADYRSALTTQYRKREILRLYQSKMAQSRRAPRVTEQELREAFEQQKAQLPMREASLTFQQIVMRAEPSEAALAEARTRADSVVKLIRQGEDFAELARRFSDDGTRENGGDLGFIRRSDVVREFANVAFNLSPGAISAPVKTQYGYHLIKVERVRGAEVQARHILLRPEISASDAVRARARADSVAARARAGEDMATLAEQYGDAETPLRGGPAPIDTLQRVFQIDLADAAPGHIIGPIPVGGQDLASEFYILRVLEREEEREWRVDDPQMSWLRDRVAQQKLLDEIVEELRRSTYVDIRSS